MFFEITTLVTPLIHPSSRQPARGVNAASDRWCRAFWFAIPLRQPVDRAYWQRWRWQNSLCQWRNRSQLLVFAMPAKLPDCQFYFGTTDIACKRLVAKARYLGKAALPLARRHAPPDSFFFFQSNKWYFRQHRSQANNVVTAFVKGPSQLRQIGRNAIRFRVYEASNILSKIKKKTVMVHQTTSFSQKKWFSILLWWQEQDRWPLSFSFRLSFPKFSKRMIRMMITMQRHRCCCWTMRWHVWLVHKYIDRSLTTFHAQSTAFLSMSLMGSL